MEVKLLVCGVLLVSFMVTGSDAQLDVCGIAPLNNRVGAAGRKEVSRLIDRPDFNDVTNNNDKTLQPLSSPADVTDDIKPVYLPPGSSVSTTIVGGNDAPTGSWPWQAYVRNRNGGDICGGSLINNQWVLTAAHCFISVFDVNDLGVVLGADALNVRNPNQVIRAVNRFIRHPDHNNIVHNNDIALLQLSSPVTFTDYVRPVCLAADGSVFNNGLNVWLTGWGDIQEDVPLPYPEKLQEVSVPIVSNSQCQADYTGIYPITSNMICAGLDVGGKGPCKGDSGGPLVVKNGNAKWIQGGVASFAQGCARPGFPGVYTRVSEYQSWILSHIHRNQPGFIRFSGATRPVTQFF